WGTVPTNAHRDKAHAFLSAALKDLYDPEECPELGSSQLVDDYAEPASRRTYFHYYAAKHMALWATVRRTLAWEQHESAPLISVGAGPLLCLFGWCLYKPWKGQVIEVEPLDWNPVRTNPNWRKARNHLLGDAVKSLSGYYVPGPTLPYQLEDFKGLKAAKSS